jgi:membrane carboxypeptidase/penicillin-binding protein
MIEEGYITRQEAEIAIDQKIDIKPPTTNITAPHFVMYIKDLLAKKYGHALVEQGG